MKMGAVLPELGDYIVSPFNADRIALVSQVTRDGKRNPFSVLCEEQPLSSGCHLSATELARWPQRLRVLQSYLDAEQPLNVNGDRSGIVVNLLIKVDSGNTKPESPGIPRRSMR